MGEQAGTFNNWTEENREKYEEQCMADIEQAKAMDNVLLDRMVRWKLGDPKHKTRRQFKRDSMYRQYTVDIRVDFTDQDKLAVVRKIMAQAGRHIYANVSLLLDKGSKPQVAVYSDDSFLGHEEISIMEDTVQAGHEQLVEAGDTVAEPEGISQEMLDAVAEVKFYEAK
jgi:hypothetical protein